MSNFIEDPVNDRLTGRKETYKHYLTGLFFAHLKECSAILVLLMVIPALICMELSEAKIDILQTILGVTLGFIFSSVKK